MPTAREFIRQDYEGEGKELLEEIYQKHDDKIYQQIFDNEFINSFLIVEYSVFNAGIAINDWVFTEDVDDNLPEPCAIFNVEELCR